MLSFFKRLPPGAEAEFHMFTLPHLLVMIVTGLFFYYVYQNIGKLKDKSYEKYIRYGLAIYLLFTAFDILRYTYVYSLPWFEYLPIATCGFGAYFGTLALFTKNKVLFVLTTFYGFGALLTLLGPSVEEGVNSYYFYQFFLRHIAIIMVGIYMTKVLDFKLYKKDIFIFIGVTLPLAILGMILGIIVNQPDEFNMFYMMQPAVNGTPLNVIHDIDVNLYRGVWIVVSILLAYLYGYIFYDKESK